MIFPNMSVSQACNKLYNEIVTYFRSFTFTYTSNYFLSTSFDSGVTIKDGAIVLAQPYLNNRKYATVQDIQTGVDKNSNKITIDLVSTTGTFASGSSVTIYMYILLINR